MGVGRKRVPRRAAGIAALRILIVIVCPTSDFFFKHLLVDPLGLVGMRAEVNPRGNLPWLAKQAERWTT